MWAWVVYSLGFGVTVAFVIKKIGENIVSEVQDAVDAVVVQLVSAKEEILAEIAALEAQEPSIDLSALKAAAQALDDVVVDEPLVVEEVEEVPVEEV